MIKYVRCVELPGRKNHNRLVIGKIYELAYPMEREHFENRRRGGYITTIRLEPDSRKTASAFASRFVPVCQELDKDTIII